MNPIYKKVSSIREFIDAIRLRVDVFIKEQAFEPGWEPDEDDKSAYHYIALVNGITVATARWREIIPGEIKIERLATRKEFRGKGIAKGLLSHMITDIKQHNPKRIWLNSQCHAQKFYEKCGFIPVSDAFDMHGTLHIEMEYKFRVDKPGLES